MGLTKREKREIKESTLIWNHGRKKATITTAIRTLNETDLKDHPEIIKVVKLLQDERKRLNSINPLEQ